MLLVYTGKLHAVPPPLLLVLVLLLQCLALPCEAIPAVFKHRRPAGYYNYSLSDDPFLREFTRLTTHLPIDSLPSPKHTSMVGLQVLRILRTALKAVPSPTTFSTAAKGIDVGVIVEPRPVPILIPIIDHFALQLAAPIHVFHTHLNADMLRERYGGNTTVRLTNVYDLALPFKPAPRLSKRNYNELLMTPIFWETIHGENILLFQTDSAYCSNTPHKLLPYVHWDFIGGPYYKPSRRIHQNGGLSFRRRSAMLRAVRSYPRKHSGTNHTAAAEKAAGGAWSFAGNEDIFFSSLMDEEVRVAPYWVAMTFAVDTLFYARPLFVHKVWAAPWWHSASRHCGLLRKACPALDELFAREQGLRHAK